MNLADPYGRDQHLPPAHKLFSCLTNWLPRPLTFKRKPRSCGEEAIPGRQTVLHQNVMDLFQYAGNRSKAQIKCRYFGAPRETQSVSGFYRHFLKEVNPEGC